MPVAGLAVGGLCPACERAVARRAARLARLVAAATTVALVGYLVLRLRGVAPAWQGPARAVGAAAAVAGYVLTYRIVKRIALEWRK